MNVLAIGAHFDDIELGCGGALAKHIAVGDTVFAYVATNSGYTNPNNVVIRSNETALEEGKASMDKLGVNLILGSFDTLQVEFNDTLNCEIVSIVEKNNIQQVYTHWVGDVHHDHHAVALSSLHSCRHVPRILMYRSNWYHSGMNFNGNFYVDITDHLELKMDLIRQHKSELERTGYKWIEFFKNEAQNAGQRIGVKYAECYELVKWLG